MSKRLAEGHGQARYPGEHGRGGICFPFDEVATHEGKLGVVIPNRSHQRSRPEEADAILPTAGVVGFPRCPTGVGPRFVRHPTPAAGGLRGAHGLPAADPRPFAVVCAVHEPKSRVVDQPQDKGVLRFGMQGRQVPLQRYRGVAGLVEVDPVGAHQHRRVPMIVAALGRLPLGQRQRQPRRVREMIQDEAVARGVVQLEGRDRVRPRGFDPNVALPATSGGQPRQPGQAAIIPAVNDQPRVRFHLLHAEPHRAHRHGELQDERAPRRRLRVTVRLVVARVQQPGRTGPGRAVKCVSEGVIGRIEHVRQRAGQGRITRRRFTADQQMRRQVRLLEILDEPTRHAKRPIIRAPVGRIEAGQAEGRRVGGEGKMVNHPAGGVPRVGQADLRNGIRARGVNPHVALPLAIRREAAQGGQPAELRAVDEQPQIVVQPLEAEAH